MRYAVIGFCLAVACLTVVRPGHTQVHVSIGINLPGPPQWVVVPGLPVYYAPGAPANVFQYNGQCYAFVSGGWYVGPGYNGTGKAGAVGGNTMTSRTDERFDPWARRTASHATRLTLLCWLLVLSIAASA